MRAKKATVSRDIVDGLAQFLAEVTYFVVALLRLTIMTGGVWAANLVDIVLGGVVWHLVIQDQAGQVLPPLITGGVGILISLVTTRAQIYFNQQLISGHTVEEESPIRRTLYMFFNFLLSLADTIVDGSLAVYLFFLRSPMDLFEVIQEGVPVMFWMFFFLLMAVSMFGDVINIMYLREQHEEYDDPGYKKSEYNQMRERRSTYATTPGRSTTVYTTPQRNDPPRRPIPNSGSTTDLDTSVLGAIFRDTESKPPGRLPVYPPNITRISRNLGEQPADGKKIFPKKPTG